MLTVYTQGNDKKKLRVLRIFMSPLSLVTSLLSILSKGDTRYLFTCCCFVVWSSSRSSSRVTLATASPSRRGCVNCPRHQPTSCPKPHSQLPAEGSTRLPDALTSGASPPPDAGVDGGAGRQVGKERVTSSPQHTTVLGDGLFCLGLQEVLAAL